MTTTSPSVPAAALSYTPDTKPNIDKQVVVAKNQDAKPSARLTTYGGNLKKDLGVKKQVTFSDRVKVKCVNPKCGRTSFVGEFVFIVKLSYLEVLRRITHSLHRFDVSKHLDLAQCTYNYECLHF